MEYRRLGRTGLKVSVFCLGTMTFRWTSSETDSLAVLDHFWEAGGNFIDTADVYSRWAEGNEGGVAETILGNWLKTKPRDQVVVATKVRARMWDGPNGAGLSRQHIMQGVEHSLRRLQTDVIDLYQVHSPDWDTPLDETLRALDDLVRAGKVRYIGASNFRAWLLMKALWVSDKHQYTRFDSIQPHYHLLNRREVEPELAAVCVDQGVGMIPYSPLAGGFLTGKYTREADPETGRGLALSRIQKYKTEANWQILDTLAAIGQAHNATIAQTALAWQLTQPFVTAPIIGANTVSQLQELLARADLRLTEADMSRLDEVTNVSRDLEMHNKD